MARIADSERIGRLLENAEGSLGRREIIEALGLSDERYEEIAQQLVAKKVVTKNRGRTGGLRLVETTRPIETAGESIRDTSDSGKRPAGRVGGESAETFLERDLYPGFAKYLTTAAAKNDESKSIVLQTYRTRARKWETPDLTEVRVTPFPMVGQWELRLATYELKRQGGWSIESVFQTATYNEFANEAWLVVPGGDDGDWVEHFGNRVVDRAGELGVGLASFYKERGTLKKHMPPRRGIPSLLRQQEWLEEAIDRLGEEKKKEEIASYIRWARSKAESGRD